MDRLVTYFVGKLQNPREEMATEESGRMWLWRESYFPNPGTAMETGRMALTQFTNSVDCTMPPTGPGRWRGRWLMDTWWTAHFNSWYDKSP